MRKLCILIIMLQVSSVFSQNDERVVEEKLEVVLQELNDDPVETWDFSPFLEKILEFIGNISFLFRILFWILLIGIVLFGLYKILGFLLKNPRFSSDNYEIDKQVNMTDHRVTTNHYLTRAMSLSGKRQFTLAILSLHRGSVEFLHNREMLKRSRDYTNREILSIIRNEDYHDPFYKIALMAEKILFNRIEVNEQEFEIYALLYRENFL